MFRVQPIEHLLHDEISHLIMESKNSGFRFLERLWNDYNDGTNTFNKTGETLIGVFDSEGKIIGIGGLNIDPYTEDHTIGRLRRFYIAKDFRRKKIGLLILKTIISYAKGHFEVVVLHTDTEQASKFYEAFGFTKSYHYPHATHYLSFA